MFAITDYTEARLASVTSRIEKHGDDDKPAVSLGLEIETSNIVLDRIDKTLRESMFKPRPDAEPELPDMEKTTPVLRCNSIDRVVLTTKHEGWTLHIDDGVNEDEPLLFGGCKIDKFSVEPRQGGSITLRFRVGTSDLDATSSGYLAMHVGQAIWVKLIPPEKKAEGTTEATGAQIDGSAEAFKKDHPSLFDEANGGDAPASPEDALAHATACTGGDPEDNDGPDSEGGHTDVEGQADAARSSEGWPFPQGAADGSSDDERSAKARAEQEQAELEAGMQQAIKHAGVKPARRGRRTVGAVE